MQTTTKQATVVNAEGLLLGRMATHVAKRLLNGEEVIIVNAEKAALSGKKKAKLSDAKEFLGVGHPRMGPFHYRRPDRIVRRTIRGMIPYKQARGKQAYKRLKVYMAVPDDLKEREMETFPNAQVKKLACPYFTVAEYAEEIGWNLGE